MHPSVSFEALPPAAHAHAHSGRPLIKTPCPSDHDLSLLRCSAAAWAGAATADAAGGGREHKTATVAASDSLSVRAASLRTSLFDHGLEEAATRWACSSALSLAYPFHDGDAANTTAGFHSSTSFLLSSGDTRATDVPSLCASLAPLRRTEACGHPPDNNNRSTGGNRKCAFFRWKESKLSHWCGVRTAGTANDSTGNRGSPGKPRRRVRLRERAALLRDRLAGRPPRGRETGRREKGG